MTMASPGPGHDRPARSIPDGAPGSMLSDDAATWRHEPESTAGTYTEYSLPERLLHLDHLTEQAATLVSRLEDRANSVLGPSVRVRMASPDENPQDQRTPSLLAARVDSACTILESVVVRLDDIVTRLDLP